MTIRYMYIKKVVPAVQETGNAGVVQGLDEAWGIQGKSHNNKYIGITCRHVILTGPCTSPQ